MYRIMFSIKRVGANKELIGGFNESPELLLIDLDTGTKETLPNPIYNGRGIDPLEDLLEEYRPYILICHAISRQMRYLLEEYGVRVITGINMDVESYLKEIL